MSRPEQSRTDNRKNIRQNRTDETTRTDRTTREHPAGRTAQATGGGRVGNPAETGRNSISCITSHTTTENLNLEKHVHTVRMGDTISEKNFLEFWETAVGLYEGRPRGIVIGIR